MKALSLFLLGGLLVSCNDELSAIGEGVQPSIDQVSSELRNLQFAASSVRLDSIYTPSSVGLLGELSDPVYGSFKGEFVTQVRSARGFAFAHKPNSIDSVQAKLVYHSYTGDRAALLKVAIYEVAKGFVSMPFSKTSLEKYRDPDKLLGEQNITLAGSSWLFAAGGGVQDSVFFLKFDLKKELGERIYQASVEHPEYFSTQEAFGKNLFGGFLFTTTTGSGAVVKADQLVLDIYYSYTTDQGKDTTAVQSFINTAQTPRANAFSHEDLAHLLGPNDQYSYVLSPAGVVTELRLPTAQMERLLSGKGPLSVGTAWMLSDAQLKFSVENPEGLKVNAPAYMLLLPKDSVAGFFSKGETERTQAGLAYLSSQYSVDNKYYNFSNISRLITSHLSRHARYNESTKSWSIDSDLVLQVVPVERRLSSSSSGAQTSTALNELLTPTLVRLSIAPKSLLIGVVATEFKL